MYNAGLMLSSIFPSRIVMFRGLELCALSDKKQR